MLYCPAMRVSSFGWALGIGLLAGGLSQLRHGLSDRSQVLSRLRRAAIGSIASSFVTYSKEAHHGGHL